MRNRRALSTVVGAVFFIIATTTVITYVTYSTNAIENFSNSVIVSQSQNVDRGSEEVKITSVRIDGGKFNMTVSNTGSLPVKLTRLWVSNQDLTTSDVKADLNIRLDPGKSQYNIGQSTTISASSSTSYNLKVVTERGNIATYQVSPNVSTRLQIIMPSTVGLDTTFRVTTLITNNSTNPNNIANLVPVLTNNGTLTKVDGPSPASIATLLQGNTVAFTSTYLASSTAKTVQFNASYTGAPKGAFVLSNIAVASLTSAEKASNSQWSQAASRVGILISGVPNPFEASNAAGIGRFGVGIINPLDRPVYIYAITISTPNTSFLNTVVTGIEPSDANWSLQSTGNRMVLWQGGNSPLVIPGKSVAQFRVTTQSVQSTSPMELLVLIQALSSEGKLNAFYSVSAKSSFSTMNMFYTNSTSSPVSPDKNWGYLIKNLKSGRVNQSFNATVENTSNAALASTVKLIILVPGDFTSVGTTSAMDTANTAAGWGTPAISVNPDGSTVITVTTTGSSFAKGAKVFQYKATVPTVTDTKLYVFQTTTVYPTWTITDAVQIASALTEAGVQVIP